MDINPNSVKICRLRLWIELLKNSYYTDESGFTELETLPNIDINIKQGNSLLSKFSLTEDLSDVFKKQKFSLQTYKNAVFAYKEAKSKDAKAELSQFISEIKTQFRETVINRDPRRKKIASLRGQRVLLDNNIDMFGNAMKDPQLVEVEKKRIDKFIEQVETEITDIENNALYRGSFEWRFEFPEVLNEKGEFVGFDAVIGNPPYLRVRNENQVMRNWYLKNYQSIQNQFDLYHLFVERSQHIARKNAVISFIIPNAFLGNENCQSLREFILDNFTFSAVAEVKEQVFEEASVEVAICTFEVGKSVGRLGHYLEVEESFVYKHSFDTSSFTKNANLNFTVTLNNTATLLINKVLRQSETVSTYYDVITGVKEYQVGKGKPEQTDFQVKNKVFNTTNKIDDSYLPEIRGRNLSNYVVRWNGEYIKYGEWLAEPRKVTYFAGAKILIRQIPGSHSLIVAYTEDDFIVDQSAYIGKLQSTLLDNKTALALLNSKLTFWFFQNMNNEFDKLFPKIKTKEFKGLPLYRFKTVAEQKALIDLTNQILTTKAADITADTSALEAEIDRMVYALYGLTEEEIAIVEGRDV